MIHLKILTRGVKIQSYMIEACQTIELNLYCWQHFTVRCRREYLRGEFSVFIDLSLPLSLSSIFWGQSGSSVE